MRPARMDDIEQVADLHLEFAQTSVSAFPSLDGHQILTVTRDRAFDEAAYLIEQNLMSMKSNAESPGSSPLLVNHRDFSKKLEARDKIC